MATDLERLVVSLDADIKKFDSSLKKAVATFNGETKKVEARAAAMQKSVNSSFADLGKGLAVGAVATAAAVAFKRLADTATRTQNSLKVAGLSGRELTKVYEDLFQAAQDNAVPVESLAALYSKVALSQKELGVSSKQLSLFVNNIGKALRVGGTGAQQAEGALTQLSQALGGGTVRAEEFQSIVEGAPAILQAVAAGIDKTGGSVAELRKMMLAGKLSSKLFFQGLERGAPILDKKLAGSALTIDQALVRLQNSLVNTVGKVDSLFGISEKVVAVIGEIASTVEGLGKSLQIVANSDLVNFIKRLGELVDALPKGSSIDSSKILDAFDAERAEIAANRIIEARERMAQSLEAAIKPGAVTPDQQRQLEKLAAALRDGSMGADELDAALFYMGSTFDKLRSSLQPLIDKLRELSGVKEEVLDEVVIGGSNARPVEGARDTSIYSDTLKRDEFFQQRNAEAMKSELEKNVDTRAKAIIDAAAKVGVALNEAAAKLQAQSEIATEAGVKSFEGAISGYVDRVINVESGGNTNAKNPDSTATGLGQFIESTWLDLFRRYYPAEAAKMSSSAILALRTDAAKSKALIEAYARENAAVLQKAGVSVDEAALQLAHFLGATDAAKVLSAAPGTPLKGLISSQSIAANPTILGGTRTVDDAIAYAQKRAGMTTSGTQAIDNRQGFADKIAEQQRMLQQLKEETGLRASLNPLVNDYGKKLTELEKAQELLNMAQQEGTAAGKELTSATQLLSGDLTGLTPEAQKQAEAMRALAQQYGLTTAAANQLQASQEAAAKSSAESLELAKSVTGGILSDIRSALSDGKITWKEWGEIAVNALNKVADKLQDMLLNQLFSAGGPLGSLLGGTSFVPNTTLGGFLGFDGGGYTGAGGKYDPAGIVHKGEYVFDQESVKRLGIENLRALHGYANGGMVGAAPRLPDLSQMNGGRNAPIELDIRHFVDDDGNWVAKVSRISGAVAAKVGREGMADYRRNQLHKDIDSHRKRPRRMGSI